MARNLFGGSMLESTFARSASGFLRTAVRTITFWTAKTGGTQVTDLLLNGSPASSVTSSVDGQIPQFQGPDAVESMWADDGDGERVLILAWVGIADRTVTAAAAAVAAGATNDTVISGRINDSTSATTAALRKFYGGRSRHIAEFGAVADGSDSSAAFQAAGLAAKAAQRARADSVDKYGTLSIELGPGDYKITDLNALLGDEVPTAKAFGLKFKGQGPGITNIIFNPATAGSMIFNDYWQGLRFEGITFTCAAAAAGSTFMDSNTTHSGHNYTFTDCTWQGPWKYVFDLKGTDNNDTFRFFGCGDFNMQDDGAFLRVGTTSTSDQFLAFWFYGHNHMSTAASFIDMAKGGDIHIFGLDCSNYIPTGSTPTSALFNLRGNTHAQGVCGFYAEGVRVEAKHAAAKLLYSEWPQGNVTFQNADWSSQTPFYTYGDILDIRYGRIGGPMYSFRDCNLAGGLKITIDISEWLVTHRIKFDACHIRQRLTPSEFVTYDDSTTGSQKNYPAVQFVGCRGDDQSMDAAGTGVSVWDATYSGIHGEVIEPTKRLRQLHVRGLYGSPYSTDKSKFNLPVGALITSLKAVAPAGATAEADGGSWILKTTDGTPVTVQTVTVATALSAGFHQVADLAIPFLCSTRAKATLTVEASNVANPVVGGFVIVEGYW